MSKLSKAEERYLVDYIGNHGPIKFKDGRRITTAVNLIEAFTDDNSCEGCVLHQRITADNYGEGCIDYFRRSVDMTLAKSLQFTGIGCSLNNQTPLILVEVPKDETQDNTQNPDNPELLDKEP